MQIIIEMYWAINVEYDMFMNDSFGRAKNQSPRGHKEAC